MSNRNLSLYLEDILNSIQNIETYTSGLEKQQFLEDQKTVDAVIRNVEIIGEAVKHIPESVKEKYIDIPWSQIAATRNKVIHEYFGVDEEILWETIKTDLPTLKSQIEEIEK